MPDMTKFNELMRKYVNEDYNTLVGLAKTSVNVLMPVCKQIDADNDGFLVLMSIVLAGVAADGVLTGKEKKFLQDVLGLSSDSVDKRISMYTGNMTELTDKIADAGNDDLKFAIVNLVASICACDETIKREEAAFIYKIMA